MSAHTSHPTTVVAFGQAWSLLPCPFCGVSEDLVIDGADDIDGQCEEPLPCYWVHCLYCSASGAGCDDAEEAVDAWNTRHVATTPTWN